MKYALLIYSDEAKEPQPQEPAFQEHIGAYMTMTADMESQGVKAGGEALKGVSTATSVRMRQGQAEITDGPFAETKEQLGGFYLLDVPDLDAALEWAKRIPSAAFGTIEIRPIQSYE